MNKIFFIPTLLIMMAMPSFALELTYGLQFWYSMDEDNISADNTTIYDISGQGNNGTVAGGLLLRQEGKINQAPYFDGINDYITFPSSLLSNSQARTVCAWFKLAHPDEKGYLLNEIRSSGEWGLYVYGSNNPPYSNKTQFHLRDSSAHTSVFGLFDELLDWHYQCGTWDGAGAGSNMILYLDGVEVNRTSFTANLGGNNYQSRIGAYGQAVLYLFNGSIDEVAYWNRSLDATEILELYADDRGYNPVLDIYGEEESTPVVDRSFGSRRRRSKASRTALIEAPVELEPVTEPSTDGLSDGQKLAIVALGGVVIYSIFTAKPKPRRIKRRRK